MHNMKVRVLAAAVAAITATTPVLSTYTEIFAESVSDDSDSESVDDTVKITTDVNDDSNTENLNVENSVEETSLLFIKIQSDGGELVLNEGEDDEQQIRLVKEKDDVSEEEVSKINVYDKDDILISSEEAEVNNYTYVYETNKDSSILAKAVADKDYQIEKFDIMSEIARDKKTTVSENENADFIPGFEHYYSIILLNSDKNVEVEFSKKDNKEDADLTLSGETNIEDIVTSTENDTENMTLNDDDLTITNEEESARTAEENKEVTNNDDLLITDSEKIVDVDNSKSENVQTENINDENIGFNKDESDSKEFVEANDVVNEDATTNTDTDYESVESDSSLSLDEDNNTLDEKTQSEHFLVTENEEDLNGLNPNDFESMRLIVLSDNDENIIDKEHLIGNHDGIYLMQYGSIEQAMTAYIYYETHADAVEPDMQIKAATSTDDTIDTIDASDNTDDIATDEQKTKCLDSELVNDNNIAESNAITFLNQEITPPVTQDEDKLIALIDTGVSENPNVIDRVSLIDDSLEGSAHGDAMVEDILTQNENAKILSIKALDDNGYGSYSAVVSAIEYAIDSKADIINMSMYSKKSMTTSVVKTEIEKAVDAGIIVVGSAGNDGANVRNYIPGCSEAAYIIGACDEKGKLIETSNYGLTIDYNVVADSTSDAAAKFTGYISKNGINNIADNEFIFSNNYVPSADTDSEYNYDKNANKVDANLLFLYAAKAYGKDFINQIESTDFADIYNVSDIEMRNIKKQMNTFFDEDTYKLNKYIEQTKLLDENGVTLTGEYSSEDEKEENLKKKDKVLSNVPMNINTAHIWEASKEGYVKNGAKISKTESGYEVEFQDGDMKALTNSPIKIYTSESTKCDEIDTVNNIETPIIFDYSWKVNQNGTITIYTFPSDTKENDMDSYFTTTLMPESMSFKAAADDYYVSGWNKWSGSISYCQMLGINWSKYSSWLYTHSKYYYSIHKDENLYKYYLGTPYGSGYLVGGAYPHGDCLSDYEGMNCTAFVWHVLWKAMANSGNGNTPAAYGLGIDRDSTFKGWTTQPINNDVKHAYFKNKKSLIKDGKPRRGDIIWVMGAGEYEIGTDDIDNHILFYWGNGTNDVGWHSTHKTTRNTETSHSSWCDGTFDPEKGAHKVMTNGNCQTEIASKQPTTFGYILYRAGTSSTGFPQLIDIKKVNKNTGEWDDRLRGTKFTLYRYNTKKEKWVKKETITIESAAAVQFKTECQPGNKYKIVETTVTEGFTKAPDIIVDVSKSNSAMVKSLTVENVEGPSPTPPDGTVTPEISEEPDEPDDTPTPEPPQIYVTKHSTASWDIIENNNEYSVGGASFGIYSDANCTQEIGTVTTGNNGISNPLQLPCVDTGNYTYYVKEKYAPKGHNLNTEVKSLTVTMPNDGGRWFNVDFWDAAKFSHIQIKKVSGDGTWNDSLKGTEFKLYYGDSELETLTIQNGEFHAFQYNCLLGKTYTIKETKTMPGKVKMKDILVTINNEISYQGTYWITATNVDAPKLQITKQSSASQDILDLSAYTVGGAEFGVYEDQACTRKIPGGTLTTNENGVTDALTLPCNTDGTYTYWVREDGAPNGHKENKTPQPITVTLPTDAGTTKQMTFTNEPKTTMLDAFAQKLDSKDHPVEGAIFKVCLYDGEYTTVQDCEVNGALKKTWYLKSDEDGLVEFDKDHRARGYTNDVFYQYDADGDGEAEVVIPIGCTVTYKEVYAPGVCQPDEETQIWSSQNQKIEIKKFYNDIYPCKITIKKLKEDGKTSLRGVKFKLTFVKESESYLNNMFKTYTPLLTEGQSVESTTDSDGTIVWKNLDQGEYRITEIQTVSGMTLLKDPINITLPITMTDKQAKDMSAATDNGRYDNDKNLWYFYEAKFEVTNTPTFKMPTTGATGVWKFIFYGFGTMAILGTGLIICDFKNKKTRKLKKKKQ